VTLVPAEYPDRTITIMGLGYVGLTLATVMVEAGFTVHGIEIRDEVLSKLQRGVPHFSEPDIGVRLQRALENGRLRVSRTIPEDAGSSVYIITVGTPIGPDGRSRMDMVSAVATDVARRLRDGDLVVLRSTVKIGCTRSLVQPILAASGKRFDLAFCPERTVEGQALEELRWLPQIVGGDTYNAAVRAGQLFQFITPTVVRVGSIETAEMIKLVDNAQRDVHFAYANEIARLCDALGISATEVIAAGKLGYPRTNLPMPGPVGGPCLEKDSYILAESAEPYGVVPEITLAARTINKRQFAESVRHIQHLTAGLSGFPAAPTVALLGLAFKGRPPTDDLRGTTARLLLDELKARFPDGRFRGFDAMVEPAAIRDFGLEPCSLAESFAGADLVVMHNNHPVFSTMPVETLAASMARPGLIYDFWNHYQQARLRLPEGILYSAVGNHGGARS
jgi:nucleotide sugar dehydrogenase